MSLEKLNKFAASDNIAADLSDEKLQEIGQRVLSSFDTDHGSMSEWLANVKKVMDLAALVGGPKNYPLPVSANIKYPLITKACYEFTSKAYPELIKDGKVVRARVVGKDPFPINDPNSKAALASRVSAYMNYQLLEKNEDFEQVLDKLLNLLALIGFVCLKTYYDPIKREIYNELCNWEDLIIHSDVQSLYDARRISHVLHLHMNDLISASRAGVFLEEPVKDLLSRHDPEDVDNLIDVVEQHCYLDLDGDDYEEPYIVTIVKDTGKVLRIKARYVTNDSYGPPGYQAIEIKNNKVVCIRPIQHFTDFHFLVSPKGTFQSVGFGTLMFPLNNAINSLLNQLIDAGQLRNLQGGFIDSRFKPVSTGQTLTRPGEFIKLKAEGLQTRLADGVFPFQYHEPSMVLFQLMGSLVQSGKELSASTEVMTGASSPENNKTGATLALIQEGEKLHTAITKRLYRSLGCVFKKIFYLNGQYLDPRVYIEVLDDELSVNQADFDASKVNIVPVADPNLGSVVQRAAKTQLLAGVQQLPGVNALAVSKRIIMGLDIEAPEELLVDETQPQPPNPEVIRIQAEIEEKAQLVNIKQRELELEEQRIRVDTLKVMSEIILNRANAMKSVAQADQAKSDAQVAVYDTQLKAIQTQLDHMMSLTDMENQMMQAANELTALPPEATAVPEAQLTQEVPPDVI